MQYRQAPRFNSRTRFERHPATNRQGALVRLPYALVAYHLVSINEQNRIGLVERDQSFDIAAVESLKEESMDFDGGLRGHLVRPLSDVRTLCANNSVLWVAVTAVRSTQIIIQNLRDNAHRVEPFLH